LWQIGRGAILPAEAVTMRVLLLGLILLLGLAVAPPARAGVCDGTKPRVSPQRGIERGTVVVGWRYSGPGECKDVYNVRWGPIGGPQQQVAVTGRSCTDADISGCAFTADYVTGVPYGFSVQGCHTRFLQSSQCSQWGTARWIPFPDACLYGFVWREAYPGDRTCVEPARREQARRDNAAAASRVDPAGRYGRTSCKTGFVWREARPGDVVCVEPAERTRTAQDNQLGPGRRIP
jgi:hypothetical protein